MEEYISGPEFSVETFSFDGEHRIFAVTEKSVLGSGAGRYVEIGHCVPARLEQCVEREISQYVGKFLTAMEIRNGPCHTELRLTKSGPKIIETHARVGGDYITGLVGLVTGFDLFSMTLGWPLGLIDKPAAIERNGAAAVKFFTPDPGSVVDIIGVEYWRQALGVHLIDLPLNKGDKVKPVLCSDDRVGFVVAVGTNSEEALTRCAAARDEIKILTE